MKKTNSNNVCFEDSLELLDAEIEELENDAISAGEAGFIYGYETEHDDDWGEKQDALLDKKTNEVD